MDGKAAALHRVDTIVNAEPTGAEVRKFSVSEYHRMADAGILAPDERVELINGVIYKMSPVNPPHSGACKRLGEIFHGLKGRPRRWIVQVQDPVLLPDDSEPEPDVALLRPREAENDFYDDAWPGPEDVFLLVEIADSSLSKDQTLKAATYARAGILEYWILNLAERRVEVHRQPDPAADRYTEVWHATAGQDLSLVAFPEVLLPVTQLLARVAPQKA